ncbi:hypothetical protein [Nocardioides alkalitolerans]|uniref:hypothetical protein n=1 Tax=Nocardioides alkalitolerans TaxID=281714 RepID=UPI0004201140|nr:hypothetical protein [Nocardioides alkalitolerans]
MPEPENHPAPPVGPPAGPPVTRPVAPQVVVRVAVTTGATTTRSDLALVGSRGTLRTPVPADATADGTAHDTADATGSDTAPGAHADVPDPTTSTFAAADLWPTVRRLLPDVPHLRAAPAISRPADQHTPPADFVEACRHAVTITVGTRFPDDPAALPPALRALLRPAGPGLPEALTLRSWLVTDDELYAVTAGPDGSTVVASEVPGALAATLQWDVAGALDHLVGVLRGAGAA